jgi:hypothetical protein
MTVLFPLLRDSMVLAASLMEIPCGLGVPQYGTLLLLIRHSS